MQTPPLTKTNYSYFMKENKPLYIIQHLVSTSNHAVALIVKGHHIEWWILAHHLFGYFVNEKGYIFIVHEYTYFQAKSSLNMILHSFFLKYPVSYIIDIRLDQEIFVSFIFLQWYCVRDQVYLNAIVMITLYVIQHSLRKNVSNLIHNLHSHKILCAHNVVFNKRTRKSCLPLLDVTYRQL